MLLEGVGLELDPILSPLLDKRLRKISGSLSIEFGDASLDYNPEFKLYINAIYKNSMRYADVAFNAL